MGEAQEISNEPTVIIEHTQYIHPGARSYKVQLSFTMMYIQENKGLHLMGTCGYI